MMVGGMLFLVTKICRWDGGVCLFPSCTKLSPSGDVVVCSRHRNRFGRMVKKRVSVG